jgi:hypothetical protein
VHDAAVTRRPIVLLVVGVLLALLLPGAAGAVTGGDVYAYGAPSFGSTAGTALNAPVVDVAAAPDGSGYWEVASDGGVFAFGGAAYAGSLGDLRLNQPIVAMAPTPTGRGYWLAAADGGVFTFGDARFAGSAGDRHLSERVVGIAAAPLGFGYWLVTSAGTVLAFGSAHPWGDLTSSRPAHPIVGMAPTPAGDGYWLAGADGGVFTFGGARYAGSLGDRHLDEPVTGIDTAGAGAYWLVTRDGAIYSFGGARYAGGATSACKDAVIGVAAHRGGGYWLVTAPLGGADVSSSDPLARTAAESAQMTSLLRLRQGCEPGASPHAGALAHPLPGARVTTSYGWRTHPIYHRPQLHTGTDFAGGSTALAAAAGRVVDVRSRAGYGLTVVIDHGNGVGTVYAHLASAAVRAGQSIGRGAAVGAVGHSGDATGNHLHFEVRVHGVTTDPLAWL